MKIFISGTKNCNKAKENEKLQEAIQKTLEGIYAAEDEVLIGDCHGIDAMVQQYMADAEYKKVTVYVSGDGGARNNLGKWLSRRYLVYEKSPYVTRLEKDFQMAEACDCGVALWDGISKGTFINMLCLLALHKTCKLYLVKEERWVDVECFEDLEELVGQESSFSDNNINELLASCGMSEEMREHQVEKPVLSGYELVGAVCKAPIRLEEKSTILSRLYNECNLNLHLFYLVLWCTSKGENFERVKEHIRYFMDYKEEILKRKKEVEGVIDALYDGGKNNEPPQSNMVYVLFTEWYDTDDLQLKSYCCGVFVDPHRVEAYIETEEAENETGDGYYRMEAWDLTDTEWRYPRYDYYYYQGSVCWFEKLSPRKLDDDEENIYYSVENREFANGSDLNLSTPFAPGDIVLIDCRPFGPPFHAMIMETGAPWDCCFPNILFQYPGTEEWSLTSLKHRRLYKDISWGTYEPMLSPLYRLRKVRKEEMTEEDEILVSLSKKLGGSEEKATEVWKILTHCHPMSLEDVLQAFESEG